MPSETKNLLLSSFLFILTITMGMLGWFLADLNNRVRAYEEETPITILTEMRVDIKSIKAALKIN